MRSQKKELLDLQELKESQEVESSGYQDAVVRAGLAVL